MPVPTHDVWLYTLPSARMEGILWARNIMERLIAIGNESVTALDANVALAQYATTLELPLYMKNAETLVRFTFRQLRMRSANADTWMDDQFAAIVWRLCGRKLPCFCICWHNLWQRKVRDFADGISDVIAAETDRRRIAPADQQRASE